MTMIRTVKEMKIFDLLFLLQTNCNWRKASFVTCYRDVCRNIRL